jgi:uncharacterized peroxidase-related enzyme
MTFIQTASVDEASGATNYELAFSQRPDVYAAWQGLVRAISGNMDLRRYELVTLAAARRLRSSYCMLAHGSVVLREELLGADELRAVATDHRAAGLAPAEVAVMDFAEKVVDDATSVTQEDVERLREHGLSDADVLDVVLAASVRCFFSKVLDGTGTRPDANFEQRLAPALREALVVGRPIAAG